MFRGTKFFTAALVVVAASSAGIGQASATAHRAVTVVGFDRLTAPAAFNQALALKHFGALRFNGPGAFNNGGGVLNEGGGFGVSGYSAPNFLAFNCHSKFADNGVAKAPETIDLGSVRHGVSINLGGRYANNFVQVVGSGGNGPESHSLHLQSAMQTVAFTHTVRKITITPLGSTCVFLVDDITYS